MSESTIKGFVIPFGPKASGKTTFLKFLEEGKIYKEYVATAATDDFKNLYWASKELEKSLGISVKIKAAMDIEGSTLRSIGRLTILKEMQDKMEEIKEQYDVIFFFYFINPAILLADILPEENQISHSESVLKKIISYFVNKEGADKTETNKLYKTVIKIDTSYLRTQLPFFQNIPNLYTATICPYMDCLSNYSKNIEGLIKSNREIKEINSILKEINKNHKIFFGSLKDEKEAKKLVKNVLSYFVNVIK